MRMTCKDIEGWLKDTSNYVINDAVSGLAGRMPKAADLARAWIKSKDEWKAAAGWSVMALLATSGDLDEDQARALIDSIRERIHGAKNRTRHSMNNVLIAIGGSMDGLRDAALEAARAIGTVAVDHGETGCKTPDAASYIERMVQRKSARSRVTGASMKAKKTAARTRRGT